MLAARTSLRLAAPATKNQEAITSLHQVSCVRDDSFRILILIIGVLDLPLRQWCQHQGPEPPHYTMDFKVLNRHRVTAFTRKLYLI